MRAWPVSNTFPITEVMRSLYFRAADAQIGNHPVGKNADLSRIEADQRLSWSPTTYVLSKVQALACCRLSTKQAEACTPAVVLEVLSLSLASLWTGYGQGVGVEMQVFLSHGLDRCGIDRLDHLPIVQQVVQAQVKQLNIPDLTGYALVGL